MRAERGQSGLSRARERHGRSATATLLRRCIQRPALAACPAVGACCAVVYYVMLCCHVLSYAVLCSAARRDAMLLLAMAFLILASVAYDCLAFLRLLPDCAIMCTHALTYPRAGTCHTGTCPAGACNMARATGALGLPVRVQPLVPSLSQPGLCEVC